MIPVTIPNRPFASDVITGLMLPDGVFEASLGRQRINAHFKNTSAAGLADLHVYFESASHPGVTVTPVTHTVPSLPGGASRVLSWDADFSTVPPGVHFLSFIEESPAGSNRTIKKIFVTKVEFDPATRTFRAQTPEGVLAVRFGHLLNPRDRCCPRGRPTLSRDEAKATSFIDLAYKLYAGHDPRFEFCPPGYLPLDVDCVVTPTPPYPGQHGDLPFQDPWWKVVLCIIAIILLIAAAIVAATEGGDITVTSDGSPTPPGTPPDCCGVHAEGGSSSYVVAGLVAAAAAAATAAAYSDARDPFRRGQDNTPPGAGELTTAERVAMVITYGDPVALGKPFTVKAKWDYTRTTTGGSYTYNAADVNTNVHVLKSYKITMPDVVYRHQPFVVRGEFLDQDGKQLRGDALFVQCYLAGPHGEYYQFVMQDDGISPDERPSDGTYTGVFHFGKVERDPRGMWTVYVIAQDTNTARQDMEPEQAAQIIGGMVRTHQLTIGFEGGTCPLVPDGHVNVI